MSYEPLDLWRFTCLDCGEEWDGPPIASRYERRGKYPNEYPAKLGDLCAACFAATKAPA